MAEKDQGGIDATRFPVSIIAFFLAMLGWSSAGMLATKDTNPASAAAVLPAAPADTSTPAPAPPATVPIPVPLQPLADSLGLKELTPETLQGHAIRSVIATVPDPDTGSYANYTNIIIESILRAAELRQYAFDRHWMPWTGVVPEASLRNSRARGDEPGVLLFRQNTGRLIVFLVGETPTAGVHIPAYKKAVGYAKSLGSTSRIDLLGPTFSGSAESIRLASGQLNIESGSLNIVSGSATGASVSDKLRPYPFRSTLITDEEMQSRLEKFYRHRSWGEPSIAVFGESGTQYASDASREETLTFAFPMQISRVREAYSSDPLLRDLGASPSPAKVQTRTELELKPAQTSTGYDKIPDWAKDLNAKSQELVLRRTVEEIEEVHPRLIQLFASDIRDLLFVSGFIRLNANRSRIVLLDNDVLYSSRGPTSALEGSLSVATFPLFNKSESSVWFSSQMGNGAYEAMKVLLGVDPVEEKNRTAWLTVFSAGENWPVAALEGNAGDAGIAAIPRRLKKTGRQWLIMTLVVCALSVASLSWWKFTRDTIWRNSGTEYNAMRCVMQSALLVVVAAYLGVSLRAANWAPELGAALVVICSLCGGLLLIELIRNAGFCAAPVALLALAAALMPGLSDWVEPGYLTGDFFAARALQLANGVSPLLPVTVSLTVVAAAAFTHIFAAQAIGSVPAPSADLAKKFSLPLRSYESPRRLAALKQSAGIALLWSLLAVPLGRLHRIDTLESLPYSLLMMFLICALHFTIAFTFVRLLQIGVDMVRTFDNIKAVSFSESVFPLESTPGMKHWMRASETTLKQREWRIQQMVKKLPNLTDRAEVSAAKDELESLQVALFLEAMVYSARRQGYFVAASVVAMAAMFQWYPFQPAATLLSFASIGYLVVGTVLLLVYLRLEQLKGRSPVYKPEPGGVSWLAIVRFVSTFGVPFLAIAGSLLPQYGRTAFQWLLFLANSAK